jgi:uncharacterized protein
VGITVVLLAAAVLGLAVGAVVGGFGGGGGVLTVPALVYVLGQSAQDATTGSVIIVGVTAVAGVLARLRGGVDWRTGIAFGVVGIPAAAFGTLVNRHSSGPVLLLAFAALTLVAAVALLLDARMDHAEPAADRSGAAAATAVRVRQARRTALGTAVKMLVCGVAVGFLTGFLGVGGGFLVVPALVIVLRMPIASAVGTSLLIIVMNAAASFASRVGELHLDWRVIAPFTVAAVVATFVGKRVADRLSGAVLARAFAVLLMLVGLFVATESLLAL